MEVDQQASSKVNGSSGSTAAPSTEESKQSYNHSHTRHSKQRAQVDKAGAGAQETFQWVYINGLGERDLNNVTDTDVLTAMTFDKTGQYLAVGDKGGRCIIFRYTDLKNSRYFDYRYFSEIQSHEPEFDHLKSIELDEKINSIEFLHTHKSPNLQLLSTNDRIIKLWKLENRSQRESKVTQIKGNQILLPHAQVYSSGYEGMERKQYKNCHNYNINSLSVSPDGESFLSADDLCINLWNFENTNLAYQLVDLKPPHIEDLQEVITHVEYHPKRSDIFLFSSSKGYICYCDFRVSSEFSKYATIFQFKEDPSRQHFFTEIINSISKAKFAPISDNYIFSRDYLSVQIWDVRNNRQPVQTLNVTEYLDKKLCEVYENERIFDKFDLQVSPDSRMVLTGSYHSHAHVIDLQRRINTTIDVRFMDKRGKQCGIPRLYKNKRLLGSVPIAQTSQSKSGDGDVVMQDANGADKNAAPNYAPSSDLSQRISMGSWHPKENTFAVAKHNSLFIYTEKRSTSS